jgi:hypothetical protein
MGELLAVAAPPSGHSLFTNHDIVKENVPCHENVDWHVLLGR